MTGNDIRAFRDRWGMTQTALAARLGVNHSTIWRWESKEHDRVPDRVAFAIRGIERDLEDEKRPRSEE